MKRTVAAILMGVCLWVGFNGLPHGITIPHVLPAKPLIDLPGLNVLIIRDRNNDHALPAKQLDIFESVVVRQFMRDHKAQIRVWDHNTDAHNGESVWVAAMQAEPKSLPWLVVSSPKGNFSGPLPADVDATLAIIGKYAE